MSDETKTDRPPEDFELPMWSAECGRDANLQAWAMMRIAAEVHNLTDAVDALYQKLDGIEQSLDTANNIAEGA